MVKLLRFVGAREHAGARPADGAMWGKRITRAVLVTGLACAALLANVGGALAAAPSHAELRLKTGVLNFASDGSGRVPGVLTWTQGSSTNSGVGCCTNDVSSIGSSLFAETTSTSLPITFQEGDGYAFQIDSYDANGTYVGTAFSGPPSYDDGFGISGIGAFTFTSGWHRQSVTGSYAGVVEYSTAKNAAASITFGGRAFELIMDKGPAYGRARITISINGTATSTILNLHATTFTKRRIVLVRNYAEDPREPSPAVTITNLGTAGHSKVDVNAIGIVEID